MNGELRRRFFNDFKILEVMRTEGVNKRELVGKLARSEPARALEIARSISEPWYRCQSLAHVALYLEDQKQFKKVIGEALAAAYEQTEPNRIVSVASWAVRANE